MSNTLSKFRRFLQFLDHILAQGKQHWLTSKIPRTFADGDYLIELCLYATLIHYWEDDGGSQKSVGVLVGNEGTEEEKVIYRLLSDAYEWAKEKRQIAEVNVNLLNKLAVDNGYTYDEMQAAKVAHEDFRAVDTMHLMNITQFRHKLWS